jgi:hypothetical protein
MLIGICGKMGAGKDTLAQQIIDNNSDFVIMKFAYELRKAISIIIDFPVEKIMQDECKKFDLSSICFLSDKMYSNITKSVEYVTEDFPHKKDVDKFYSIIVGRDYQSNEDIYLPITIGRLMQIVGSDCFRNIIGEDVWVKKMIKNLQTCKNTNVVISDVRFPNEADLIKKTNGVIVYINRDLISSTDKRSVSHISETAIDSIKYDYIINNNGSIKDLYKNFTGLGIDYDFNTLQ